MYLNIKFAGTDRAIDIYMRENDDIYMTRLSPNEVSTSTIRGKKLFDLIQDNKKSIDLRILLDLERVVNTALSNENRVLKDELKVLKSAISIIKKD